MPNYVERDRPRPIPGAFGLERSEKRRKRANAPYAQYFNRTGYYADKLYIYVEEEYGYASYLWVYPGTPEELVTDWCTRRVPWNSPNWLGHGYRGEFDSVNFQTPEADRGKPDPRSLELVHTETGEVIEGLSRIAHFGGRIHIHEEEDSFLKVGFYEVNGIREPKVVIHVLDALAAIR